MKNDKSHSGQPQVGSNAGLGICGVCGQQILSAQLHPCKPETAQEREARIYADVFNPAESDLDYFLRRKRELGL
jgi:hypothetical protein